MALDWMAQAACKGVDTALFFPKQDAPIHYRPAIVYCVECPVRAECLKYALDTDTQQGMWGGLSPRDRRRIVKGELKPEEFTLGHGDKPGTSTGYHRHIASGVRPCQACTTAYIRYTLKGQARMRRLKAERQQAS